MQLKENDKNTNKLTLILIAQHQIIRNLLDYDKEFKPKQYNENLKKAIKELLKFERKYINDLF